MEFTPNQAVMFFILHLVGDYLLQTGWMADNKRKHWTPAVAHAVTYALPFLLYFHCSIEAWALIFGSHLLIDRFGLARYVIFAKNKFNDPRLVWENCNKTGYPNDMPPWLSTWLLIIADNTIHLVFNYIALVYL